MMRILALSFVNHNARTKPIGPAPTIRTSLRAMVIPSGDHRLLRALDRRFDCTLRGLAHFPLVDRSHYQRLLREKVSVTRFPPSIRYKISNPQQSWGFKTLRRT